MEDTPLGRIVQIRMERDPKIMKSWGRHERDIRAQWGAFQRKDRQPGSEADAMRGLQAQLRNMFKREGQG